MELKKVVDSLLELLKCGEVNVRNINEVIKILEDEKIFLKGFELDQLEDALELNGIEIKIDIKKELPYCMMAHSNEEMKEMLLYNYGDNKAALLKDFPDLFAE